MELQWINAMGEYVITLAAYRITFKHTQTNMQFAIINRKRVFTFFWYKDEPTDFGVLYLPFDSLIFVPLILLIKLLCVLFLFCPTFLEGCGH